MFIFKGNQEKVEKKPQTDYRLDEKYLFSILESNQILTCKKSTIILFCLFFAIWKSQKSFKSKICYLYFFFSHWPKILSGGLVVEQKEKTILFSFSSVDSCAEVERACFPRSIFWFRVAHVYKRNNILYWCICLI